MAYRIRLPRAPGPGPMVVDGDVWDRLCDVVEWLSGIQVGNAVRHDGQTGPIFVPRRTTANKIALLSIGGAATGGGWYTANVLSDPSALGTLDPSITLGTGAGSIGTGDVYFLNLNEITKSTHDLTNAANTKQKYFLGLYWGKATDGKDVYVGNALWYEDCT